MAQINTSPEKFVDYILVLILLSIFEKNNKDFLLNKNEEWKKLCEYLGNNYKGKLLNFFLSFNSLRRSRFSRLKDTLYNKKYNEFIFKIINSKNNNSIFKEEESKLIENTITETLNLLLEKNLISKDAFNVVNSKKNRNQINKFIHNKLNKEFRVDV